MFRRRQSYNHRTGLDTILCGTAVNTVAPFTTCVTSESGAVRKIYRTQSVFKHCEVVFAEIFSSHLSIFLPFMQHIKENKSVLIVAAIKLISGI
jgi:hypothetical protein